VEKELQNILEKVIALYRKYGIKTITMDDVARELGISKKTLYQYVEDKNELVNKSVMFDVEKHFCLINCIKEKKLNAIDELLEINRYLSVMLKDYNPSWDYDLKKYYAETYTKLFSMRREQMLKSVTDNIKRGIEEGFYRDDINADIIAKLHLLRIENLNNNDIFSPEDFASAKVFNELFKYHIRGIANDKGIKYIENKLKTIKSE
jgi:AcrR family transcriptional regulator